MIPLRDTIPTRSTPVVTRLLLVGNVAVFAYQVLFGFEAIVRRWGFVPRRLFEPEAFGTSLEMSVVTLLTAMFLHGGLLHLGGNMLYLWIFGDNVEDALGPATFFLFYLACGLAGSLGHAALYPASRIPTVGASGAIAGVLGAYFLLFPRSRIVTLVPLFILFPVVEVPAFLYLLVWFAMQFFSGSAALLSTAGRETGGVAFWAHVGGFASGFLLAKVLAPERKRPVVRYRIS